jgi:hypothetical protein
MPPDNPINTIIHLQEHLPKSYEFKKETSSSHGVALTRNNRDQFICLSGEFADGVDFHCEVTEEISASCDGKFKNEKIANFQMRDLCSYRWRGQEVRSEFWVASKVRIGRSSNKGI